MKKFLLKTMLLLCALVAGSESVWAETTYKLTQVTSVETGYLYVFEQAGYVMNNSISSSTLQTTNTYNTTGLTGKENYIWKLETATKGFYLNNISKNSYLNNSSSTSVSFGTKSSIWSFNFQTDGTVIIQNNSNSDRFLGYTSSTSHAYKAYATSNFSSYPHAIKVYKLEVEGPAAPTFNVPAGEFPAAFDLTISGEVGTTLKYTTDGSNPADAVATASNTVTVNIPAATTTVRAIVIKDNVASEEATATYTFVDPSKTVPSFSLSDTELNLKVNDTSEITLTTNSDGTISFSCEDSNVSIDADDEYAIVSASAAGIYTVNVTVAESAAYLAASGTVTLNVTKKATTLTIDASAIGDTDIYTNKDDNLLGAIVKYGETTVTSATVTWTSSDTDVAIIDNEGVVTLKAVGTTTITATYAGNDEYVSSSNTYELTITDSTPYVQPTQIKITPNYSFWGQTAQFSGSTYDELSGEQDNVSLAWSRGTGSTYANTTSMRFYKDNSLTFTAPTGYEIKSIEITGSLQSDLSFSPAGFESDSQTWSGAATAVTMSRPSDGSSYASITNYTIEIGLPSSVATPVITLAGGLYNEIKTTTITCETVGATIYYTLDGSTPTSSNTEYTGAISITESCTLKAIAIKGDESSNVASATYTLDLPYTTIAEVKALTSGSSFRLNLTGAQVVFIDADKKNIYVRDNSGAVDLYYSSGFTTSLKTGDILNGIIEGTYSPYKNLPEITNITSIAALTATSNETVVAKTIEGTSAAIAANLCDLVKIENTQITESNSKYYVGTSSDIQLYDNFSVGYTVTTGKDVDVSGIATVYNTTYELFPRFVTDIVYLDNSVAVEIGAAGIATFCSTEALDFTSVDAIAVYTAKAEGNVVKLTQIHKVPATTGVILMNALGMDNGTVSSINVPVLTSSADDVSDNELVGVTTRTLVKKTEDDTNYNYILQAGPVFNMATDAGAYMPAGKAYLSTAYDASASGARLNVVFDNEDTGINVSLMNSGIMSNGVYDLQGRNVKDSGTRNTELKKGLYIVNGKKVVIK